MRSGRNEVKSSLFPQLFFQLRMEKMPFGNSKNSYGLFLRPSSPCYSAKNSPPPLYPTCSENLSYPLKRSTTHTLLHSSSLLWHHGWIFRRRRGNSSGLDLIAFPLKLGRRGKKNPPRARFLTNGRRAMKGGREGKIYLWRTSCFRSCLFGKHARNVHTQAVSEFSFSSA